MRSAVVTIDSRNVTGAPAGATVGSLVAHLRTIFDVSVEGGPGAADVSLADASHDSRHQGVDWLFCCTAGSVTHGAAHAAEAVGRGATALLTDRPAADVDGSVPRIVVPDARLAMAHAAAHVHGHPSADLGVIGVTGTNGKTTTVAMIASVLRANGWATAEMGTLHGRRTTPEATDFQRFLAAQRAAGISHVVTEVSSHALALHRVDATEFAVGVFTNLGRDHLDFHADDEEYFRAKARLFRDGLCRSAVINADDNRGRQIIAAGGSAMTPVSPGSARILEATLGGSVFEWEGLTLRTNLPGGFNVANAVLAAAACRLLGVSDEVIAMGIAGCVAVRGRCTVLTPGAGPATGPTVVVDYAHTPEGLAALLASVRPLTPGRLAVVFGCGGDRDRGKRPEMGRTAGQLADAVTITSDNPRHEDPRSIADEIVAGVAADDLAKVDVELDRAAAIARALRASSPGDTVVVAGKGHESTQEFADRTVEFDDIEVASGLLDAMQGSPR